MNRRIFKKQNKKARCIFIAHKIGTLERGVWTEYFKKHHADLVEARKYMPSYSKKVVNQDVAFNYKNPHFNQNTCDKVIFALENGDFRVYPKLSQFQRVSFSLRCVRVKGKKYTIADIEDGNI